MHLVIAQVQQRLVQHLKNVRDVAPRLRMHLDTAGEQLRLVRRLKRVPDVARSTKKHLATTQRTLKRKRQLVPRKESMFTSVQDVPIRRVVIFLLLATNGAQTRPVRRHRSVPVPDVMRLTKMRLVTHGTTEL